MAGALEDLRVIDLGEGVASAFCSRLFADYGAEVIKLEPPDTGDVSRSWGPFPGDRPDLEASGTFFFLNTNKRSVALDPGSAEGRATFLDLAKHADLLVESQPLARLRSWNLEPAMLSEINPDLIVLSLSPFGRTGPYAEWLGYDLNAFHFSGAGSRYCGERDRPPLQHGTFSAEFFAAYAGAAWALAALLGREAAGGGQHLDVSYAEVVAALFTGAQNIGGYAQDGVFERRAGSGRGLALPATIAPCRDGHVWLIALEPAQWDGLRAAMGDPEWARPDAFRDMFERARNADLIEPRLREWTRQHTKQEIMDLCQAHGVPTTAVYTVGEAAEHPHIWERGYRVELEHPVLGTTSTIGPPLRLPDSPGGPRTAAPLLGQHSEAVLREWRAAAARHRSHPRAHDDGSAPRLPLAGLRVANFGCSWLGPVAGQTLAFLGAEVYKIESRVRVDINRTLPPFAEGIASPDRSLQNHAGWAGNGSVTLNLKQPEAVALAKRLVAQCDVVLENFSPGTLARLGLGFEELCAVRPDLIMVSMPAAGAWGKLSAVRTYGTSLASLTGLDAITGYYGGPPVPVENAFCDPLGGLIGAFGALLALAHHRRTGRGQHVELSQQEGIMQLVGPAFMDWVLNGRDAVPLGNRHPLAAAAPHGVFPCAGEDRWVSVAVASDEEWHGLVRAMGQPEWALAAEFGSQPGRIAQLDLLHERLAAWTSGQDDYALAHQLQAHGVAAAPVLNVADLLSDPHYRARGTFIEVQHPLGFRETIYGAYVKTSRSVVEVRPGPAIGQDNEHVFRDLLGLSEDAYHALIEAEVIY